MSPAFISLGGEPSVYLAWRRAQHTSLGGAQCLPRLAVSPVFTSLSGKARDCGAAIVWRIPGSGIRRRNHRRATAGGYDFWGAPIGSVVGSGKSLAVEGDVHGVAKDGVDTEGGGEGGFHQKFGQGMIPVLLNG